MMKLTFLVGSWWTGGYFADSGREVTHIVGSAAKNIVELSNG